MKVCKISQANLAIIDGDRGVNYPKQQELGPDGYCLFLSTQNVTQNGFKFEICKFISKGKDELLGKGKLKRGDIVITTRGTLGNIAWFDEKCAYENIRINSGMAIIRNLNSDIDTSYLFQLLRSSIVQNQIARAAFGSAQPQLTIGLINGFNIPIPNLKDQILITKVLSTWDIAIEKMERLIEAKEKHLKYLVNKLVSDKIYHKAFVRDVAIELSARNNGERCKRVLSVTNTNGFVLPEDQFERRVASEDLSNYKFVRRGQYAYNPSRINVGSIARLGDWPEGVLSPMYVVFSLDENQINSDFFLYWLSSYEAGERIKRSAQGSVRETVSFQSFGDIAIPLPPLDTQLKIAELLNVARNEIDLLKKHLEALRKQKRGLMRKLLTGEWRVKTATEEE